MIFNSVTFFIFLAIVYFLYRFLPFRGQNIILLVASYIFYGWWDQRFLFLIILSTSVDFCCGLMIDRGQLTIAERLLPSLYTILAAFLFVTVQWSGWYSNGNLWHQLFSSQLGWFILLGTVGVVTLANLFFKKLASIPRNKRSQIFLVISIVTNLGILGFFKYFNFFIDNAEVIINSLEMEVDFLRLNIILPVGISFYTFQTMSYTIDIYKGKMNATRHFFDFALFVSFFPQLVAGPIERASALIPRLLNPRVLTMQKTTRGLFLIWFGLFKKVGIADSVGMSVNAIYSTNGMISWLDIILATLLFAVQIYCDFSGYSDIARGTAKLFGIELMTNFNLPYFSKNPSEFWRRWHISLSTWLRDYLYIPLGGNRKGQSKTYLNLMITMVLGGLWHGAGWNFILWGFYQGILLCLYRVFGTQESKQQKQGFNKILSDIIAILIFFILTCYGWLLFRANSFEQIANFTKILLVDFGDLTLSMPKPTLSGLLGIAILFGYEVIQYYWGDAKFYLRYPSFIRGAFYGILTIVILMGMSNEPEQFIYFQF